MRFVLSDVTLGNQKGRVTVSKENESVDLSLRYYVEGRDEPSVTYTAYLNANQASAVAKALLLISEQ